MTEWWARHAASDYLPEKLWAKCESFLQKVGLTKGWRWPWLLSRPCKASEGKLAAGSLMDCYLLKGTSPRPLRYHRGSWETGANDRRPPKVSHCPPQCSSLSALKHLCRAPSHRSCLISGDHFKKASCFLLFSTYISLQEELFKKSFGFAISVVASLIYFILNLCQLFPSFFLLCSGCLLLSHFFFSFFF